MRQFLVVVLFVFALVACNTNAVSPKETLIVASTTASVPQSTLTPPLTQTPLLLSTDDYSTPAPPASEWMTYVYPNTGLSFKYPANWHIWLDEDNNRVVILNAPPNSVIAIKGYADDFMRIDINLNSTNIGTYGSIQAFVEATLRKSLPPENFISVEGLPTLPQGYTAVRLITLGYGESLTLYVSNKNKMIAMRTSYVPESKPHKKYLGVMEQIAGTLVIP